MLTTIIALLSVAVIAEATVCVELISDIACIDDGDANHTLDIYGFDKAEPTKTVLEAHGGGFVAGSKATNTNYILNSYEGTENGLLHVFNTSHTDWAESIAANQDEIDFMNGLVK